MPDNEMTKPFNPLLEFQPIAEPKPHRYEIELGLDKEPEPEFCQACGEQMQKTGNGYVCYNPDCQNYDVLVML